MTDDEPQEPGNSGREFRDAAAPHPPRPPHSLVLCGARLVDGRTVDVRLVSDRIEAVGTAGSLRPAQDGGTRVDLSGYLLLPAPAEPHAHYDTALTADPPPEAAGRNAAGQKAARQKAEATGEDVQRRTTEAALLQLGQGATALRTHVHIGGVAGLRSLEAVLQARRSLRGLVDLSAVAVPRLLTGAAGAEELAILRDAVKMGASAVGGCPDLDPDPGGYVEAVLEVAAEHGCHVDLHTDGSDPARLTRLASAAGGLRPGVSIGPCAGLARLPHQVALRTADQLAAAGVTVVCLPQGNCGMLERPSPASPSRVAPARVLAAAGVSVAAGSGALRDASNQVGRGDPLEAAYLLASHGEARPESAYDAISALARAAMGLPEVRVEAGFPAELLAVRGSQLAGALSLAYSRIVVHRGRVVARTSAVREYCDLAAAPELGLPRQSQG
ncbi:MULTISPECIES: hydrolase [unclassified Streptomyces]|uniref:hydrolase n=1 Tax=unclassified Streptomyces TaxID=2593676 RepID=UPI002DD91EF3|nr:MULTISPECIES: hydrolase [unclassified Streptomyces]WSA93011.1 hydrolase [Streptomyces sp. NBC_01795]WSB77381.1 hydrolase [Streptomyces sp. NBC_01775]WSS14354.1 hydrolase [Streptomyces sp. NBC_01186]WSS43172.1 hydrolase [Streptomyces sp. NBC_01187]